MAEYTLVELGNYDFVATNYVLPQKHTNCEIVYYRSCKGITTVGDEVYSITGDNLIFIPPNTEHDELIQEAGQVLFFRFNCKEEHIPFGQCMFFFRCANSQTLYEIIERILSEQVCKRDGYIEYVDLLVKQLIMELQRLSVKKKNPEVVKLVEDYIKLYYYTDINFEYLSESYGYSLSRLRHLFKEEKQVSIYQYLIDIRISAAKRYLNSTNIPIKKIASLCGYTEANFITMFNQRVGITPMQYRLVLSKAEKRSIVLKDSNQKKD